jgi:hypothetical protein
VFWVVIFESEEFRAEDHIYIVTSLWSNFRALARIIAPGDRTDFLSLYEVYARDFDFRKILICP